MMRNEHAISDSDVIAPVSDSADGCLHSENALQLDRYHFLAFHNQMGICERERAVRAIAKLWADCEFQPDYEAVSYSGSKQERSYCGFQFQFEVRKFIVRIMSFMPQFYTDTDFDPKPRGGGVGRHCHGVVIYVIKLFAFTITLRDGSAKKSRNCIHELSFKPHVAGAVSQLDSEGVDCSFMRRFAADKIKGREDELRSVFVLISRFIMDKICEHRRLSSALTIDQAPFRGVNGWIFGEIISNIFASI